MSSQVRKRARPNWVEVLIEHKQDRKASSGLCSLSNVTDTARDEEGMWGCESTYLSEGIRNKFTHPPARTVLPVLDQI